MQNMLEREVILTAVKEKIFAEIRDLPIHVYLFGSWARGQERPTSDIDIALDAEGEMDGRVLLVVREALEESTIPYRVDVVDMTKADIRLVENIRKEGILWTE